MIIVLMGVSGAGKTTVGRLLASRLGWPFYDGDDFHPPANVEKMRAGRPLRDADRGRWLSTLQDLIAGLDRDGRSAVLACSALKEAYRERLTRAGRDVRVVYLRGSPALIAQRLAERRGHFMPAALLQSQFAALEEPRDAVVVDIDASPEAIADRIEAALGARAARPPERPTETAALPALEMVRTERLVLTRMRASDFADLCRMHRDAEVMRTLGGVRSDDTTAGVLRQLTDHWDAHGFGYWMARHGDTGAFVGRGGLRHVVIGGGPEVEIGYALMREYWGHGYATELARACIRVGFDLLALADLVAFTLPINDRSQRVMERVGLVYEREVIWNNLPHVLYRLRAADWRRNQRKTIHRGRR